MTYVELLTLLFYINPQTAFLYITFLVDGLHAHKMDDQLIHQKIDPKIRIKTYSPKRWMINFHSIPNLFCIAGEVEWGFQMEFSPR